jgi:hypothetical protein
MRRLSYALFAAGLALVPTAAGVTTALTTVSVHAAYADDWNCDDSYMPCDGSNMDYLTGDVPYPDYVADAPPWFDPIYGQNLGDPGDPTYEEPQPWWGDDGPYW